MVSKWKLSHKLFYFTKPSSQYETMFLKKGKKKSLAISFEKRDEGEKELLIVKESFYKLNPRMVMV